VSGNAREAARQCPICAKPATAEAFPFCSKRCADIDLNRWLKGGYAIPAEPAPTDDDVDAEGGRHE
jgi:endogenous inhibitor of DNA gyrase (YacG/DUF329 family)